MAMDGVEVERYPPHNIFKEAAYEYNRIFIYFS
jgi:hypothetical protein